MAGNLTAMIAAAFSGGAAPPVTTDPYFDYTTLLLPGNGTNGAQNNTFLDGSTNNFTITRNGNTTQGTFSPFSQTGWGNYFDGTGDYLSFSGNLTQSGNFTIECWVYITGGSGTGRTIINIGDESSGRIVFYIGTSNEIRYAIAGVVDASLGGSITNNTWAHIAIVRSSTTVTAYVNGTATGTTATVSGTVGNTNGNWIGSFATGSNQMVGYISSLRVVTGTAVYTSNFTPPTSPLTPISGTSLLTCQSNRFIDNSSNNFTITKNGDTSVVAFSPFNPSASWSAATYGGSGYFDGSGDYLTVPQSAGALDLGSGQFSLEFWWYPTSAATSQYPFIGESTGDWYVGYESNSMVLGRRATNSDVTTTGFTLTANTWQHVVVTRQSTSTNDTRIFINGVLRGIGTTSQNYTIATTLRIGGQTGGSINGYLSSINLVKGSVPAAYQTSSTTTGTQIFTPPTSPSTSVTGTQLLLNYTNAGIYDATSKNDLETVGNAQISTTQSKWGGSSISFDGTGDWLQTPVQQNFVFGTGDFTVEFWIYANALSGYQNIFDGRTVDATLFPVLWLNNTALEFYANGSVRVSSAITTSTWYHVALSRSGTSTKLFINGTQVGSTYTDSNNYVAGSILYLSRYAPSAQNYLNGYIQDLRVTKGYARYTANFTAPTAAFPTL